MSEIRIYRQLPAEAYNSRFSFDSLLDKLLRERALFSGTSSDTPHQSLSQKADSV